MAHLALAVVAAMFFSALLSRIALYARLGEPIAEALAIVVRADLPLAAALAALVWLVALRMPRAALALGALGSFSVGVAHALHARLFDSASALELAVIER